MIHGLDFSALGFEELNDTNEYENRLDLYFVQNPDGSIRWLWNQNCSSPIFLKFFAEVSLRAKCIASFYRCLFFLKVHSIFFRKNSLSLQINPEHILAPVFSSDFALFSGTVGVNRKWILYGQNKENQNQFYKIATTNTAEGLLQNEFRNLNYVQSLDLKQIKTPKAEKVSQAIIALEDISNQSKREIQISSLHIEALSHLLVKTIHRKSAADSSVFQNAKSLISELESSNDPRISKGILKSLKEIQSQFDGKELWTGFAHRDFTSWNAYIQPNQLAIYDWELASEDYPAGYDLFHFIIQNSVLVERLQWIEIKPKLVVAFNQFIDSNVKFSQLDFNEYLSYYLYLNISYYLSIYQKQDQWHIQVEWLLNLWSDALSDVLKGTKSNRILLIRNLFDFLQNKSYATIKLNIDNPELISLYSDIDIAIKHKDAVHLITKLKHSRLVKSMKVNSNSFMHSISIQLADDSFLAIDLIEKFVRKSIVYLDIEAVLNSYETNSYGIKNMNANHTKKFIQNFYGLNHSTIPSKYQNLFSEEELKNFDVNNIIQTIKKCSFNKPFNRITNSLNYLFDMIQNVLHTKSLTITFSGVDGAGKSTVIERVKFELEKKFRRQVVVLRHRPSILPILSVWTKGKVEAEKSVLSSLPRQGSNNSRWNSLFRFSYYFLDYFFGQFIILFRYNLRGIIVLYDRYYYDFILDGKRSNIELPCWITIFGYNFIFSPKLNFFLYADSKTILSRKQELDENTIEELTKSYTSLFDKLNTTNKIYETIENIDLETTIQKINNHILNQISK